MCIGQFGSWVLLQEPEPNRSGLREVKMENIWLSVEVVNLGKQRKTTQSFNITNWYIQCMNVISDVGSSCKNLSQTHEGGQKELCLTICGYQRTISENKGFFSLENPKSVAAFVFIEIRTLPLSPKKFEYCELKWLISEFTVCHGVWKFWSISQWKFPPNPWISWTSISSRRWL